jgi:hypothetical protein
MDKERIGGLRGRSPTTTFVDANTLTLTTPGSAPDPQQLILTNPDGEPVTRDVTFTQN